MPLIVDEPTWIPELDREDLLYHRLFLAEKWLVLKLRYGHVDPRDAGVGNIVNCGAAMYIAPVGIVNAGDPDGAYLEALDLTCGPPVELRPRGRRRARSRRRRGDAAGRDARVGRRGRDPARQGRNAHRDRGGRRGRRRPRRLARRGPRRPAGRVRAVRLGRRALRRSRLRTPARRAASTRSRSCRSRSGSCSRRTATTRDDARRRQLRPRLRLDRLDGRRARRGARLDGAAGAGRGDRDREPARPRGAGAHRWPTWRRRSSPATGSASKRAPGRWRSSRESPFEGHAGSSRRISSATSCGRRAEEGKDVDGVERRWLDAGGKPAPSRGASQEPATPELRELALELLDELDALPRPLAAEEPEELEAILALADPAPAVARRPRAGSPAPGSAAPSAACSGSRSRTSRARASARSRRAPATGR